MTTVFKNKLLSNVGTQLAVTVVAASTPSAGSVRLTFADQGTAPFAVGQLINVTGISVSGYNGLQTVTGCTSTTVTYSNSTTGAATGGTISPAVLSTSGSATTTAIGLSLTNVTGSIIVASVQLQDTVAGTTAYFVQNVVIPPNTSARLINGGERLVLGASTYVMIWSNQIASMDIVLSYVEIS
jgi:hypothetical protein